MKAIATTIVVLFSTLAASQSVPAAPATRFLRPRNMVLFSLTSVAIAADGVTTQRVFRRGWNELNPIAQPFGKSPAATAGLTSLGLASVVGGSWIAHRRGWRRLEWMIPVVVTGVEGAVAVHNAKLRNLHYSSRSQR